MGSVSIPVRWAVSLRLPLRSVHLKSPTSTTRRRSFRRPPRQPHLAPSPTSTRLVALQALSAAPLDSRSRSTCAEMSTSALHALARLVVSSSFSSAPGLLRRHLAAARNQHTPFLSRRLDAKLFRGRRGPRGTNRESRPKSELSIERQALVG